MMKMMSEKRLPAVNLESARVDVVLPRAGFNEVARVRAGLMATPARLSPKYFYDELGCALFNKICALAAYYPTRTEEAIFVEYAAAMAAPMRRDAQWIDLGCGDCEKSRRWLAHIHPRRLIGVDIAETWLRAAIGNFSADYPQAECLGVVADFTDGLDIRHILAECAAPPIFFYPGSSIGNFSPADALSLLRDIRRHCGKHGQLLISVDLIKDQALLNAAYNDVDGITAAFNKNILRVINSRFGANFQLDKFSHHAFFNAADSRIEMHLLADEAQRVSLGEGERIFAAGESIVTEYSYKYTREDFAALLEQAGFAKHHFWTDACGWFGVFLAEVA